MVKEDLEVLKQYYEKKEYNKIIESFTEFSGYGKSIWFLLCTLFECGESALFLELYNLVVKEKILFEDSSRIITYNALIEYSFGKYELAFSLLNKTANRCGEYSYKAKEWLNLLDYRKYNNQVIDNMFFIHFSDDIEYKTKSKFIQNYYCALTNLKRFFDIGKIGEINVYVYNSRKDSIGNNLSYSNIMLKAAFVFINDECGHEITHIVTENLYKISLLFLSEGIAECFDQKKKDYQLDNILNNKLSIEDMCENIDDYNISDVHLVAGVFVANALQQLKKNPKMIQMFLEASSYSEIKEVLRGKINLVEEKTEDVIKKMIKRRAVKYGNGEKVYDSQYRINIMQK